jgi:Protein of unknown function (DUF2889)
MSAKTVLPHDDIGLEPLHDRTYTVGVFRSSPNEIVARGTVLDEKPPGVYVEDDPDPLMIHHMTVELTVAYPSLEILGAQVDFGSYPQPGCPGIADAYRQLTGISIARGFTHRVRELFGGPGGCTHVTALLQAMAPAVVQSTWSMRILNQRDGVGAGPSRGRFQERNRNTCHVWASDGDLMAAVARGETVGPGIPIRRRLAARGQDPQEWWERLR